MVETILSYGNKDEVLKLINQAGTNDYINYSKPIVYLCPEVPENEIKESFIENTMGIFPKG